MSKIKVTEASWNSECTTVLNLTEAHAIDPNLGLDKVIMYSEKRYLMTFITAGATNGAFTVPRAMGKDTAATRIPVRNAASRCSGKRVKTGISGAVRDTPIARPACRMKTANRGRRKHKKQPANTYVSNAANRSCINSKRGRAVMTFGVALTTKTDARKPIQTSTENRITPLNNRLLQRFQHFNQRGLIECQKNTSTYFQTYCYC